MPAFLLPNAKQQFIDTNGRPLVGGTVGMYLPNTLIFKNTWQDPEQTVLNTNPIVLDARGQAEIWGSGSYRQIVKDSHGNLIWDEITSVSGNGTVTSISELEAIRATDGMAVYLYETYSINSSGRSGWFGFNEVDLSTEVAADTLQGIFVAPNSDPTGASGAWVRVHDRSSVQATWWGAIGYDTSNESSPTMSGNAIQAAIDYVFTGAPDSGFGSGGVVWIPPGWSYWGDADGPITVRAGVFLQGASQYDNGLVWKGTDNTNNAMVLGYSNGTDASFDCGLRMMSVRNRQEGALTSVGKNLIYSRSVQQNNGGLENVYLVGEARTLVKFEIGDGGAATFLFRNVEVGGVQGASGNPNNPMIILDYGSATVDIENLIIQGGDGPSNPAQQGISLLSGSYRFIGGHSEEMIRAISVNFPDQDQYSVWVWGWIGGAVVNDFTIASGTYDSGTGKVVLTLTGNSSFGPENTIEVSGLTGTGVNLANLNGSWDTIATTSGTTVSYQAASGLGAITITGGDVLLDSAVVYIAPTSKTSHANNYVGIQQSATNGPTYLVQDARPTGTNITDVVFEPEYK